MAINSNQYQNKIKQNLWANKAYNIFFYNFTSNSKRYRGLIDVCDKVSWNKKDRVAFAEAELAKIKKKRVDNIVDDRLTLNQFMLKHLKYHADTKWKKDKEYFYNYNVKDSSLGRMILKDIRPMHIKDIMETLKSRGLKQSTVFRLLEVLRPVFKEAMDNRVLEYDPTINLKIKKSPTKKIVINATEEFKKIHEAIMQEYFHDPFYKSFFLFALNGRRRQEIMTLKWEDIDFENNFYVLRHTKNNEEQKIYLPLSIKNLLLEFFDDAQEYVFSSRYTNTHIVSIQSQINKLKKRTNNDRFCLHYLRNVLVSAMAEKGLSSIYLSGALGHNDPNTIKKYLTLNYLKSSEMASGVIDGIVKK